jgi:hypothetical protein
VITTLDGVTKKKAAEQSAEQRAAVELVRLAQEQGLSLTGPDGLLKQLTKTVLETALNEEMTEHLGYEKHDPLGWTRLDLPGCTARKRSIGPKYSHSFGPFLQDQIRVTVVSYERNIVRRLRRIGSNQVAIGPATTCSACALGRNDDRRPSRRESIRAVPAADHPRQRSAQYRLARRAP